MAQMTRVSRVLSVLLVLLLAAGCSDPKPAAKPAEQALESKPTEPEKTDTAKRPHGKPKGANNKKLAAFDLGACDASLRFGSGIAAISDVKGTSPLRKIELVVAKGAFAASGKLTPVTVTVHERTAAEKSKKVGELLKSKYPAPAQGQLTKLGDVRAAFIQIPGATKTDTVAFGCDDRWVEISTQFAEQDAVQRKLMSRLLTGLKVGKAKVNNADCRKQGDKDCASPMLPTCTAKQWTCAAPKSDKGDAPAAPKP
jgi:hypothetical protein